MAFKIGKWGKILDGKYKDWYLMIDDDTKGSIGGFYIYTVKDPKDNDSEGYDCWVENIIELERHIENLKFKIYWNDKSH